MPKLLKVDFNCYKWYRVDTGGSTRATSDRLKLLQMVIESTLKGVPERLELLQMI